MSALGREFIGERGKRVETDKVVYATSLPAADVFVLDNEPEIKVLGRISSSTVYIVRRGNRDLSVCQPENRRVCRRVVL